MAKKISEKVAAVMAGEVTAQIYVLAALGAPKDIALGSVEMPGASDEARREMLGLMGESYDRAASLSFPMKMGVLFDSAESLQDFVEKRSAAFAEERGYGRA